MLILALVKDIEIIGEAAARVSTDCKAKYPQVPWLQMIGMRNRLTHAYFEIDKLKTKRRSDLYIVSDRITANQAITENGTHYGVEVLGKVFDHLSPEGLSRENWLNDLYCRGGQFLLEELDSLQQPKPD